MIVALLCLKDLLAVFSFLLILQGVFSEQLRPGKWRLVVLAVVCASCSVGGYLLLSRVAKEHVFDTLDFVNNALALCAFPFVFRKPKFWRGFAVLFLYYCTVDTLWSFLAALFKAGIVPELVFDILISVAVVFAVMRGRNYRELNVLAGAFAEIPAWMFVALFLFELTCYYKEFGASKTWYDVFYAVSACLIFVSILYLAFRVFRLVYTQNDILRRLNEQLLYATQKEQSDESIRRFRHDFKNHTIVLNAMLEQGDPDGAKRYLDGITADISGAMPRFSTGNSVVNSLLNIKSATAAEQNTTIMFDGMIPETGVEPKDMCVIVGNLIDNAIEACTKLPEGLERSIRFSATAKNNTLLLRIVNPVAAETTLQKNEMPGTTKADKRSHGIGLKNVRDIAKKYNGTLRISTENGVFSAEILMEIQKTEGES